MSKIVNKRATKRAKKLWSVRSIFGGGWLTSAEEVKGPTCALIAQMLPVYGQMSDLTFWIIQEETGDASSLTLKSKTHFREVTWMVTLKLVPERKALSCPLQPNPPRYCPFKFLQPFIDPFILYSSRWQILRRPKCIYSQWINKKNLTLPDQLNQRLYRVD